MCASLASVLGVVFIASALLKAADPRETTAAIEYLGSLVGYTGRLPVSQLFAALLAVEIGLAALLLTGVWRGAALGAAALLLMVFTT